jgi:hypothetical protein
MRITVHVIKYMCKVSTAYYNNLHNNIIVTWICNVM